MGSNGRRPYEATVRDVTNAHDRLIGHVVVFHDVGEYLGQQQRLDVLNRVFRHDVRTETNLIHGYADQLKADPSDERALAVVKESATRILDLSEQTRTASELFDPVSESSPPIPFDEIVETVASKLREEFPHATVSVDDDLPAATVPALVTVIAENLCSNALLHNDADSPSVWIHGSVDGDWVELVVADDGPGIDEDEYDVLQRGTETPLKHGSGIGLWMVKWGIDHIGGSIEFDPREPRGTRVTVSVPTVKCDRVRADKERQFDSR